MAVLAAITGYLLGSIPTAGWLGKMWGTDLRTEGSGNPGAKNALSTSGPALALNVLLLEAVKGFGTVHLGFWLSDDVGAVTAGVGAAAGNVYNLWYRLEGGKGLGISLGILLAAWPTVILPILTVMVVTVLATRSTGLASLTSLVLLIVASFIWQGYGWPSGGIEEGAPLTALALGLTAVLFHRHWRDSSLNGRWRTRAPA